MVRVFALEHNTLVLGGGCRVTNQFVDGRIPIAWRSLEIRAGEKLTRSILRSILIGVRAPELPYLRAYLLLLLME